MLYLSEIIVLGYVAILAATTLCLLLLISDENRTIIQLWVGSNVLNAASMFNAQLQPSILPSGLFPTIAVAGGWLKYLAISGKGLRQARANPRWYYAACILAAGLLFFVFQTKFRLLALAASGLAVAALCVQALLSDRRWRGLPARKLLLGAFVASMAALAWRLTSAYPFGSHVAFIGADRVHVTGLLLMNTASFFMQIGFLGLVAGRRERTLKFSEKRSLRTAERSRALKLLNDQLVRSSNERTELLHLLTHEVRQPLNNAQATIQTVLEELRGASPKPGRLRKLVGRTEAILDSITLALSNAIVGASLIDRAEISQRHQSDVHDLIYLALLDCPQESRSRVHVSAVGAPLFLDCDPVLMRLALRNLVDNAIKYSPSDSGITVSAGIDDVRHGVVFTVWNCLLDDCHLEGDIFSLKVRGSGVTGEGQGLGLFIVSEVARLHHGDVTFSRPGDGSVAFVLFIPV